jgi:hypothetical protein
MLHLRGPRYFRGFLNPDICALVAHMLTGGELGTRSSGSPVAKRVVRTPWLSVVIIPGLALGWLLVTSAGHHRSVQASTLAAPLGSHGRAAGAVARPSLVMNTRGIEPAPGTHPVANPVRTATDAPTRRQSSRSSVATPLMSSLPTAPTRPAPPAPARAVLNPRPTTQIAPSGGCGSAIAYLRAHAAPGFTVECPGNAFGHQAMTCVNIAGYCPGQRIIAIAVACPASWMNEASNSWVLTGRSTMALDPYGYCH